jgi:hypothetical protein
VLIAAMHSYPCTFSGDPGAPAPALLQRSALPVAAVNWRPTGFPHPSRSWANAPNEAKGEVSQEAIDVDACPAPVQIVLDRHPSAKALDTSRMTDENRLIG